jgi:hypothetical protein
MNSSDHSGHNASLSPENGTGQAFRQTPPENFPAPNGRDTEPETSAKSVPRFIAGLALAPVVLSLATWLAPRLPLAPGTQDLATFASAVATVIAGLFVLSAGWLPARGRLVVGAVAASIIGALAIFGVQSALAVILVGSSLVALGHTVGHAVGSRIEHPGHLLPACVVAACVDLASVIHPQGPTHAVVSSQRALDLLTLTFPVLGTPAFAPSIGVGDMVFVALVLGTAVRHRISTIRVALLAGAGLVLAGLASALLEAAVPALPAIGLCVVLGVGESRQLKRRDRKTATVFMVGAVTLAVGVVISRFLA